MGHITADGVLAICVYLELIILPLVGAVGGFYTEGWRGMVSKVAYAYKLVLELCWTIFPVWFPICLAGKYPAGSPGRKLLLSVAWLQYIPIGLYAIISICARYTLSTYLDDWIICTASAVLTISFVIMSAYTAFGWAEIDFITNISAWETLKATPMTLLRFAWAHLKLPVTLWSTQWWSTKPLGTPIQDEEKAEGYIEEKGFMKEKNDLSKQVREDHATLAEQDKDLQEKILQGTEA